ncbi:15626_t:CDS:2, partial [Racocetra persica]
KNDLRKNDLRKNDLRENNLKENDLREDDLREECLRENSLEKDNSHAETPVEDTAVELSLLSSIDENLTSIEIVTSTKTSHKDNENNFERHNFPQKTFTTLYNSFDKFEAAKWIAFHPDVLKLAIIIHNVRKNKLKDSDEISSNTTKIFSNTTNSCDSINLPEIYKPSISKLSEFISEDVWKKVLQLHLKATDYPVLKNNSVMFTKLGTFVYQAVRKVLVAINSEQDTRNAIRKCDEITLDLQIFSKLGIVKTLPVRELLTF